MDQKLDELVETKRWRELARVLYGLDADGLALARTWFRRGGRAKARQAADWLNDRNGDGAGCGDAWCGQVVLAAALAPSGEEAVRWCDWGSDAWKWSDPAAFPKLAAIFAARGHDWCAEYVVAASERRRGTTDAEAHLACLSLPLIALYDLPVPAGELYARGWVGIVRWCSLRARRPGLTQDTLQPIVVDESGARFAIDAQFTLASVLAATPKLHETLLATLATPDAMKEFSVLTEAQWSLETEIRRLVGTGALRRSELLVAALESLTRNDAPSAQRATATLLSGLDLAGPDVAQHLALVLHLVPSVHGSVTSVLLTATLAAGLPDEELLDLGLTILARKEKAQKKLLLAYLSNLPRSETVTTLLETAAASDDETFAAKARALLPSSAPVSVGASDVPWGMAVEPHRPEPFWQPEANPAGLAECLSDSQTWPRITTEATWLDLMVRYGARDLDGLRETVASMHEGDRWSGARAYWQLRTWAETGEHRRSYDYTSTTTTMSGAGATTTDELRTLLPDPRTRFVDELVSETLRRLGTLRELLSAPSFGDGTLVFGDLVERIGRAEGYGSYDLAQALLRLEATPPASAEALHGHPGLVDLVRRWVSGDWESVLAELGVLVPTTTGRLGWEDAAYSTYLGVLPWAAESLAEVVEDDIYLELVAHTNRLPILVSSAGPFGVIVHRHLARLLGHPRQDCRVVAAENVLRVMRQGRLDPLLLREGSLALLAEGSLPLARTAAAWEIVILGRGLELLWPTVRAAMDFAASAAKKPAGLADLLRMMRPYVPVVAAHVADPLPESVRALAKARGSSKAAVEARALVEAVSG